VLPRAPWLQTPPPCSGGLRCGHVAHGFEPCLSARRGAPALSHVHVPQRVASINNKERLNYNDMQQCLYVFKTRPHVTEARARHAVRCSYHDLQIMRAYATVPHYSASLLVEAMTRQDGTTLHTAHHVPRSIRPSVSTPLKISLILLTISVLLHRVLSALRPYVGHQVSL
jgi:hypothetical protein